MKNMQHEVYKGEELLTVINEDRRTGKLYEVKDESGRIVGRYRYKKYRDENDKEILADNVPQKKNDPTPYFKGRLIEKYGEDIKIKQVMQR